jgi:hypothetical protein
MCPVLWVHHSQISSPFPSPQSFAYYSPAAVLCSPSIIRSAQSSKKSYYNSFAGHTLVTCYLLLIPDNGLFVFFHLPKRCTKIPRIFSCYCFYVLHFTFYLSHPLLPYNLFLFVLLFVFQKTNPQSSIKNPISLIRFFKSLKKCTKISSASGFYWLPRPVPVILAAFKRIRSSFFFLRDVRPPFLLFTYSSFLVTGL